MVFQKNVYIVLTWCLNTTQYPRFSSLKWRAKHNSQSEKGKQPTSLVHLEQNMKFKWPTYFHRGLNFHPKNFSNNWITNQGPNRWLARSPDLTQAECIVYYRVVRSYKCDIFTRSQVLPQALFNESQIWTYMYAMVLGDKLEFGNAVMQCSSWAWEYFWIQVWPL